MCCTFTIRLYAVRQGICLRCQQVCIESVVQRGDGMLRGVGVLSGQGRAEYSVRRTVAPSAEDPLVCQTQWSLPIRWQWVDWGNR
ncbi:hypothetical protein FKM82_018828 [Ascaphus truei]